MARSGASHAADTEITQRNGGSPTVREGDKPNALAYARATAIPLRLCVELISNPANHS